MTTTFLRIASSIGRPLRLRRLWLSVWVLCFVVLVLTLLGWLLSGRYQFTIAIGVLWPMLWPLLFALSTSSVFLARRSFGVVCVVTVGLCLPVTQPWQMVSGCTHEEPQSQDFVLFSANVELGSGRADKVASEAVGKDADIVALQEVSPEFLNELERQPGFDAYTYSFVDPRLTTEGVALYSKFPLEQNRKSDLGGSAPMIESTVQSPHGDIKIYVVHTSAPVTGLAFEFWQDQFDELVQFDSSQASVLVGDLNAWSYHEPFRRLSEAGWTDATTLDRCGFAGTWPAKGFGSSLSPLELDHVLVGDQLEVVDVSRGQGNGSDHRSLTASLRLKPDLWVGI